MNYTSRQTNAIKELASWIEFWTNRFEEGCFSKKFLERQIESDLSEIQKRLSNITNN